MKHFTEAVRAAVKQQNWYAALSLALALPDICGKMQDPAKKSGHRYIEWCTKYLVPTYTSVVPRRTPVGDFALMEHSFLTGRECYALRCAVLHEGSDVLERPAREELEGFIFTVPMGPGISMHRNQINEKLQLEVDQLCLDICKGVDTWCEDVSADEKVQERIRSLMKLKTASGGSIFV